MIYVSDIFIVGFTYLFMMAFENALHKASHNKESGQLYTWHKIHHKDYPVTKLETDIYIEAMGWLYSCTGSLSLALRASVLVGRGFPS